MAGNSKRTKWRELLNEQILAGKFGNEKTAAFYKLLDFLVGIPCNRDGAGLVGDHTVGWSHPVLVLDVDVGPATQQQLNNLVNNRLTTPWTIKQQHLTHQIKNLIYNCLNKRESK